MITLQVAAKLALSELVSFILSLSSQTIVGYREAFDVYQVMALTDFQGM